MIWKPYRGLGVVTETLLLRQEFYAWLRNGHSEGNIGSGDAMKRSRSARTVANLGFVSAMAISLGACGTFSGFGGGSQPVVQDAPVEREMPASIRADEIVGRWGLAS